LKEQYNVFIDEAGRGCLAGELVVCGLKIIDNDFEAYDSKSLTQKERKEMKKIIEHKTEYKLVIISSDIIDKIGISGAMNKALNEIISYFGKENLFLFDGNNKFGITIPNFYTEIKADANYKGVSAASILAKEKKNELMLKHHNKYPYYNWDKNFGYGTKDHINAIKKYGYSPLHRKSFRVRELEKYFNKQTISVLF
jgi:ribonuclease HII